MTRGRAGGRREEDMIDTFQGREAWPRIVSPLLALAALSYCVWRAHALSLTHDEALSYMGLAGRSWAELFMPQVIGSTANNHFLNSLAMKAGLDVFGPRELALRWLALGGGIAYCLAAWGLSRMTAAGGWARAAVLALLLGQPYVLDFFSLARGYGAGMGFGLAGIWLMLRRVRGGGSWRCGAAGMGCAMLAVMANLTFAHLFLALAGALLLGEALRSGLRGVWPWLAACAPPAALLILLYLQPVRLLMETENIFFGGSQGFVHDTVQGLLRCVLYAPEWSKAGLLPWAWGAALLVPASFAVWCLRRVPALGAQGAGASVFPWISVLLMTCGAGAVAQHVLLGTLYPMERGAIMYIPLFCLWIAALCRELPLAWGRGALWTVALCCAVNTAVNANLHYTRDWRYDACTRDFVRQAAAATHGRAISGRSSVIGLHWLNAPAAVSYLQIFDAFWLRWVSLRGSDPGQMDIALLPGDDDRLLRSGRFSIASRCPWSAPVLAYRVREGE